VIKTFGLRRVPGIEAFVDLEKSYDAIVVGSGLGGATAAYGLVQEGLRTLLVEKGEFLSHPYDSEGPTGLYMGDVHGRRDKPFEYVGGQTKFYGAAMFRMRESDFCKIEHENGSSPGWPISYFDLETYYERAEILYRVHGSADGDPTEPPRANPFPYPAIDHVLPVAQVVKRLRRAGVSISYLPKGLDYGPNGRCTLCSTCDGYYCTLDAKMDAEIAAIRPALATGLLTVATGTECLRIETRTDGKSVLGLLVKRAGVEYLLRSDRVIIAAGLPHTALLLRRSHTDLHPEGLGNQGGALGKYMSGQSMGTIFPLLGTSAIAPAHVKTFAMNEFYHGSPEWRYPMGTLQVTGQLPFWRLATPIGRPFAFLLGQISLMCIYVTEALSTRETGYHFEGDRIVSKTPPIQNARSFAAMRRAAVDAFRRAGYFSIAPRSVPYSKSECGTARFGDDPSTSVANQTCQVHGVTGLYIADASVLPSAGAINTGLTIAALALRTARSASV
jgi:choline dehydrogenase-like flavoprotein